MSARNLRFLPLKSASNSIYIIKKKQNKKIKTRRNTHLAFYQKNTHLGFPSSHLASSLHIVCFPVVQTSKSQPFSLHLNRSSLVCCSTVLYLNRFPFKGLLMCSSH
ncbi:hypothetical protein MtrunA17_Chr6g0484961 [Medicago truncatula]|uniref:Uncharacterized protein n=1 Tax=Medicago truncatula TaxID=3880 RepID=A0A396HPQ3_MEDTR|nr:hypothetical protein MtrunA17_Chr6g0484961 [Medicago truncatula]